MRNQRRVVVNKPQEQADAPPPKRIDGSMNHNMIFIYPAYIDKNMTLFQGRKLPIEECVDNPWIEEISRAIADLEFEGLFTVQKRHPRNFWKLGRASIFFYKTDEATGERVPIYPEYPRRKDMFRALAKKINENRTKMPQKDLKKMLSKKMPFVKVPGEKKVYNRETNDQKGKK